MIGRRSRAIQLTELQLSLLLFVNSFTVKHGYAPSQAEMARYFGITQSVISHRLHILERQGLITLSRGDRRTKIVVRYPELESA